MKKKVKMIIPALAVALILAVIGAGFIIKSQKGKKDYKDLVRDLPELDYSEETGRDIYEYLLTDEKGLVTTYTFRTYEQDGREVGRVDVDGASASISAVCAVTYEEDTTVFVFARYSDGAEPQGNFQSGDILAKLHFKDGRVIPELVELPRHGDGDLVRNY